MFKSITFERYVSPENSGLYGYEYKLYDDFLGTHQVFSSPEESNRLPTGPLAYSAIGAAVISFYESKKFYVPVNFVQLVLFLNRTKNTDIETILSINRACNPKFAQYAEIVEKQLNSKPLLANASQSQEKMFNIIQPTTDKISSGSSSPTTTAIVPSILQKTSGDPISQNEFLLMKEGSIYVASDINEMRIYKNRHQNQDSAFNNMGKVNKLSDMRWPTQNEFVSFNLLYKPEDGKDSLAFKSSISQNAGMKPSNEITKEEVLDFYGNLADFAGSLPGFSFSKKFQLEKIHSKIKDIIFLCFHCGTLNQEDFDRYVQNISTLNEMFAHIHLGFHFEPKNFINVMRNRQAILKSALTDAREKEEGSGISNITQMR